MQLGPIAIASDPARDRVLVLNYLSSSLTVADGSLFRRVPSSRPRSWPPTDRPR